jgi:hypothetical protein
MLHIRRREDPARSYCGKRVYVRNMLTVIALNCPAISVYAFARIDASYHARACAQCVNAFTYHTKRAIRARTWTPPKPLAG